MMRRGPRRVVWSVPLLAGAVLVVVAACGGDEEDTTRGENGVLSFRFAPGGCVEQCSLDRKVLVGSTLGVDVTGGDLGRRMTARLTPIELGTADAAQACACERSSPTGFPESRPIDPSDPCEGGTKTCTFAVTATARGPGDARLEVIDPAGAVIDATTLHFRFADRADTRVVSGADSVTGGHELQQGQSFTVASRVYAGDEPLLLSRESIVREPRDGRVLQIDRSDPLGDPLVGVVFAVGQGETILDVTVPQAPIVSFPVRVLAPPDAGADASRPDAS